jgi:hypothetical protein
MTRGDRPAFDRRSTDGLTESRSGLDRRRRAGERPVYHAVPTLLGVNRARAEAFAAEWRRWVGGGGLALARSDEGRRVLALARANRHPAADSLLTQRWR